MFFTSQNKYSGEKNQEENRNEKKIEDWKIILLYGYLICWREIKNKTVCNNKKNENKRDIF